MRWATTQGRLVSLVVVGWDGVRARLKLLEICFYLSLNDGILCTCSELTSNFYFAGLIVVSIDVLSRTMSFT